MNTFNFQEPSRQSVRGIVVLFGLNSYKIIKSLFVFIAAFSYSLIKNKALFGVSISTVLLLLVLILLLVLTRSILQYLNFKFHVYSDDFFLSKGIINKENISVSKTKIQNIYIKQNVLQQLIHVVQLDIETAGDAKAEVKIIALSRSLAIALKEELLLNISNAEVTAEFLKEDHIYYKASIKKLLLEGFSQNHIKSFLIIFGFIGGLYSTYENFLENLKIGETFKAFMIQNQQAIGFLIVLSVSIVLVALFISILFSIVNTFLLNYNLQVIEHKKTVEIKKGLFNKVAINLLPSRIQNIEIVTNRVKQYFGLNTLRIKQAMVDKKLLKHFSIVGLSASQATYLSQKFITSFTRIQEKAKPEKYYIRILFLKALFPFVFINFISFLIFNMNFWIVNIISIPLLSLLIYWRYKKAYYSINDTLLVVGSGSMSTSTQVLEIHKIQAVATKQGLFQKIRKIATVQVFTASKVTNILYVKEDTAHAIVNFLLYQVESQRKDWM
ncbi:PH domain-containing protein [Lacinutrix neustonica]|uniref:PH domain-containing protein n=1 Tax=Lacinutrix neustonica TaxID=2980107 RepID=A0A9E8MWU5_9FLAO|nr:PH domain-containing protein [Lacinutrix neustonica]WAC02801.1 PH domain-containing protein [Lacinutrix neustonica]